MCSPRTASVLCQFCGSQKRERGTVSHRRKKLLSWPSFLCTGRDGTYLSHSLLSLFPVVSEPQRKWIINPNIMQCIGDYLSRRIWTPHRCTLLVESSRLAWRLMIFALLREESFWLRKQPEATVPSILLSIACQWTWPLVVMLEKASWKLDFHCLNSRKVRLASG